MRPARGSSFEDRLLTSALELAEAPTRDHLRRDVARLLASMIDFDELLWTRIALTGGPVRVLRGGGLVDDPELAAGLARDPLGHPAVASYVQAAHDRRPRRISDVVGDREWLGSALYAETFHRHSARHQLSLVTTLSGGTGEGWVLTRSGPDFSDEDVRLATLLLPTLIVLDRLADARGPAEAPDPAGPALTEREREVLTLVAQGMTAARIGRVAGISEATVRKHLEHVYRKLGHHDRLTAVAQARSWGLV